MQLMECVPNFSDGRDGDKIDAIAHVIRSVLDVQLLHIDIGYDANRTVMTFVGPPESVVEAAYLAIKKAQELIDMSIQNGAHPRIGATDVCPLIPIANMTIMEVDSYAQQLGKRIGDLGIPVFMYEFSAKYPDRKNLATIRQGEYEGLAKKLALKEWQPDYGPKRMNKLSGATVIGARLFLIAYNVNLNTKDEQIAKRIAREIRESGYKKNGFRIKGRLKKVKAIGWYMKVFDCAQVSTNIIDYNTTPLYQVFESIKEMAYQYDVEVSGSELIGMLPEQCWQQCVAHYSLEENEVIKYLGLNSVRDFILEEKIIERKLRILENQKNQNHTEFDVM